MGKGHETWNKKDREQKRLKAKQEKQMKKKERQKNLQKGNGLDSMMAYVDEYGNISSSPPDRSRREDIKLEDIEIGVPKQRAVDPSESTGKGTVDFFNEAKGYGFIKDSQTRQSFFVHVSNCKSQIQEKNQVIFDIEFGPKGPVAVNVQLANESMAG